MKSLVISAVFFTLVSAVALEGQAKYDGYKVVRVKSSAQVKKLIQGLSLATWNGAAKDDGFVDVVVPPGVRPFDTATTHVMHEDLGASIGAEAEYGVYAGMRYGRKHPLICLRIFD